MSLRILTPPQPNEERAAFVKLDPSGFFVRHPPKPHMLDSFITPDESLFQTIHMGAAVVDKERYMLVIDGLVRNPFALTFDNLCKLPQRTVTSFHECYGSPIKPATTALWRVGNVEWIGVSLNKVLEMAEPLPSATFVWSEGLDRGEFFGVEADRYQKDLPLEKAMRDEVLLAYKINGEPLSQKRGGPLRLVVPGWFGTNSTKWLSRITLQDHRATGPYTTRFYNEPDPDRSDNATRPVWQVEPNSMIIKPHPDSVLAGSEVLVEGWTWHHEPVKLMQVSLDGGQEWRDAAVSARVDYSWQRFAVKLQLSPGRYTVIARATSVDGLSQPLSGRRNHCHGVAFRVEVNVD
ncbi:hypothetical protein Q7P37_002671 [Cladosporium fusiforme]